LINKGITLKGAFSVGAEAYLEAIRIIESGRFPLERMHSGKFELADTEAAIRDLGDGDGVHVCVCPEGAEATGAAPAEREEAQSVA
jgi:threonine dehydrogenase-like Zn-dependent dehydrogenase